MVTTFHHPVTPFCPLQWTPLQPDTHRSILHTFASSRCLSMDSHRAPPPEPSCSAHNTVSTHPGGLPAPSLLGPAPKMEGPRGHTKPVSWFWQHRCCGGLGASLCFHSLWVDVLAQSLAQPTGSHAVLHLGPSGSPRETAPLSPSDPQTWETCFLSRADRLDPPRWSRLCRTCPESLPPPPGTAPATPTATEALAILVGIVPPCGNMRSLEQELSSQI